MSIGMSARSPEFILGDHDGYSLEFFPAGMGNVNLPPIFFAPCCLFLHTPADPQFPKRTTRVDTGYSKSASPERRRPTEKHCCKFKLSIGETEGAAMSCDLGFTEGSFNFFDEKTRVPVEERAMDVFLDGLMSDVCPNEDDISFEPDVRDSENSDQQENILVSKPTKVFCCLAFAFQFQF